MSRARKAECAGDGEKRKKEREREGTHIDIAGLLLPSFAGKHRVADGKSLKLPV